MSDISRDENGLRGAIVNSNFSYDPCVATRVRSRVSSRGAVCALAAACLLVPLCVGCQSTGQGLQHHPSFEYLEQGCFGYEPTVWREMPGDCRQAIRFLPEVVAETPQPAQAPQPAAKPELGATPQTAPPDEATLDDVPDQGPIDLPQIVEPPVEQPSQATPPAVAPSAVPDVPPAAETPTKIPPEETTPKAEQPSPAEGEEPAPEKKKMAPAEPDAAEPEQPVPAEPEEPARSEPKKPAPAEEPEEPVAAEPKEPAAEPEQPAGTEPDDAAPAKPEQAAAPKAIKEPAPADPKPSASLQPPAASSPSRFPPVIHDPVARAAVKKKTADALFRTVSQALQDTSAETQETESHAHAKKPAAGLSRFISY